MMKESKVLLVFETSADEIAEMSVFRIIPHEARQHLFASLCADHAERLSAGHVEPIVVWGLTRTAQAPAEGDSVFDTMSNAISHRTRSGSHAGDAVADAFETMFEEGYRTVLIVFSHVVASLLHHAREGFALLDTFDDGVVVGAVNDGSIGVIGLRHHARDVLEIMRTAEKLASDALLRMLPTADCIILPLATLRNPTTAEDLRHLVESSDEDSSSALPLRFLAQLRHLHQREPLSA